MKFWDPMKLPGLKGEWAVPDKVEVNEAGVPIYTFTVDLGGTMKEFKPLSKEEIKQIRGMALGTMMVKDIERAMDEIEFWRAAVAVFKNMGDQSAFLVALQDFDRWSHPLISTEDYIPVEIRWTAGPMLGRKDTVSVQHYKIKKKPCPVCNKNFKTIMPSVLHRLGVTLAAAAFTCENDHTWYAQSEAEFSSPSTQHIALKRCPQCGDPVERFRAYESSTMCFCKNGHEWWI